MDKINPKYYMGQWYDVYIGESIKLINTFIDLKTPAL